ncbi:hypothetical protein [Streptomyces sp. NPDC091268]|uniref:hypothetical protein n=1 Tax=Streptomyces sp. NPDC091268 TaxID=3365979 RepID=UPI003802FC6A
MSAAAGVERDPRPSAVSMGALLAAGAAATAVSTPPARERQGGPVDEEPAAVPGAEPEADGAGRGSEAA